MISILTRLHRCQVIRRQSLQNHIELILPQTCRDHQLLSNTDLRSGYCSRFFNKHFLASCQFWNAGSHISSPLRCKKGILA